MLEKIDFNAAKMTKEEYKPLKDELVKKLVVLQQQAHAEGIGVVCVVAGVEGSGRGTLISDIIYRLDARAASVVVGPEYDAAEAARLAELGGVESAQPLMAPYWELLRSRGDITFYDQGGWYGYLSQKLLDKYPKASVKALANGKIPKEDIARDIRSMKHFEQQVHDDGYIVLKFFMNITEKEQRRRIMTLAKDEGTAWRVTEMDMKSLEHYQRYQELYDLMLENTNYDFAPWILLNGEDKRRAHIRVLRALVDALDAALNTAPDPEAAAAAAKASENSAGHGEKVDLDERRRTKEQNDAIRKQNEELAALQHSFAPASSAYEVEIDRPTLASVDYHLRLPDGTYREALKAEQARFRELEFELYRRRGSLVVLFEGQDGAGKGSAIKRICAAVDAKAYTIFPSPAPTKPELMHPFLWRYWTRLPKMGHVGIYDRSWYGRVLVERVEGFASPAEWGRAYDEINSFEQDLVDWGALVVKFWVEIDRDEQMRRFEARESTPEKQWKITDEDWRNRDKAPQYREAVEDMFRLTSTKHAPWHVLESNDKEYARVKALRIINDELERHLRGERKEKRDKR